MLEVGLAEVLTVSWLPETNHIQWANVFFFPLWELPLIKQFIIKLLFIFYATFIIAS